ncbi:MAG: hypothetical protein EOP04_31465, partial [Proteobacteria bacterium]
MKTAIALLAFLTTTCASTGKEAPGKRGDMGPTMVTPSSAAAKIELSLSENLIVAGEEFSLNWQASNAKNCTLNGETILN